MEDASFLHPSKALRAAGIHEGLAVADFGAGSGFFTRAAAREVGEGVQVYAVDLQPDVLPRIKSLAAAEGLHNVEVVRGDIEVSGGSNLPKDSFDFVILANVLFSLERRRECAAEMRRVLKRGGTALVIDWTGSHGGLGPHESHVISREEAQALFEALGFSHPREIHAGAYHWGFTVRKKER